MKLVLTCEHAFPDIPEKYRQLFLAEPEVLLTHEAFDPGAFDIFNSLQPIADASHYQEIGRLLVESNRSTWHKRLFSRYSGSLDPSEKKEILDTYYFPYRKQVESSIQNLIAAGEEVLHLSVHSFTPILHDKTRNADIGLLYDPHRKSEKELSIKLKQLILKNRPKLKIRFNYPYLGKADGFTTSLRKTFSKNYSGIEVEINQKWVTDNKMEKGIKTAILEALKQINKV